MTNHSSPEVAPEENLLRYIGRPEWWDPDGDYVSSAIFGFPKFSAFIASMTTEEHILRKAPDGTGLIEFNSGEARKLGFDARHEPENNEESHANVYRTRKKKQARKLLGHASTKVVRKPDVEKLKQSNN